MVVGRSDTSEIELDRVMACLANPDLLGTSNWANISINSAFVGRSNGHRGGHRFRLFLEPPLVYAIALR